MRSLIAVLTTALLVIMAPALGLAQKATPTAETGMPVGVSLEVLAQALVEEMPPGPTEIGFAGSPSPRERSFPSSRSPVWPSSSSSPGSSPSNSRPLCR
jgi:hypothetical protein